MKNLKKVISILLLIILIGAQATTVSAYTLSTSTSSSVLTTNQEISQYKEYLNAIIKCLKNLDTTNLSLDDAKVEIYEEIENLQEEYSDVSGVSYVTNQILIKLLTSSTTSSTDLVTSLKSILSSLLTNTSVVTDSLTPDEVITIQAESAGNFAGKDYNVKLSGNIYYADSTSDNWVVLVHGFMMTGQAIADAIGEMYLEQGYNVFAPDLRGWGNSEGEVAMGYLEMLDVYDWLTYLNANYDCNNIIVHGISLGGATVIQLSGYEDENGNTISDQNVIGIVDDCGYTSMVGIVQDLLETIGSNELVAKILGIASIDINDYTDYDTVKEYIMNNVGVGLTEDNFDYYSDGLNSLNNCTTPILIIHGTDDAIVPFKNSDTIYDTAVANTNIPYIQRFEADSENHAFIVLGSKENMYEGHVTNFIEQAEAVANGETVTRISTYEDEEETSTSFITKLVNALKLIKNILGL